jgi:hypothetical protein
LREELGIFMGELQPGRKLSEPERRKIFQALVAAQDRKVPVDRSRKLVAARFHVSEGQVKEIEQEGVEGTWPPLGR